MEKLSVEESWDYIKQIVFKAVPMSGTIEEFEKKKQAIETVFETVENALKIDKNGE